MKKLFFSAIFLTALTTVTQAQSKIEYQLRGGLNLNRLTLKEESVSVKTDLRAGFHLGAEAVIPLAESWFIQPGLLFSQKGGNLNIMEQKVEFSLAYIEIPATVTYKHPLGNGRVMFGAGPYAAVGLNGKLSADGETTDIKFASKINDSDVNDFDGVMVMRRVDLGVNFLAGYEYDKHLFFQLGAQLGAKNLQPKVDVSDPDLSESGKTKNHNSGFSLSIGYRF